MSSVVTPVITASLRPDLFPEVGLRSLSRKALVIALSVFVIAGAAFRVTGLAGEGLSEDELNKLNAVSDYRAHGLTSANAEHPLLMKAALTVSVIAAEKWNGTSLVSRHPEMNIPIETSLRLPGAILGALAGVLIFLVGSELFGSEVGLIAAALWAFDPLTISFNRIAKEDTFLVFFFLLANLFWLRSQRVAESQPQQRPDPFYWAAAASFGAMLASKYLPQMLVISVAYYYMFQAIPPTRWRLGKKNFLKFFAVMGIAFLICNPTILLPDTWRTMANFAAYKMIGHDSYEFIGHLYPHRMGDWLKGEPWYFYLILFGVKLPIVTLAGCLIGLILLFRRATGDGRYFVLFWFFVWALVFTFTGGKFTRYATSLMPAIVISAALGFQFVGRKLGELAGRVKEVRFARMYVQHGFVSVMIVATVWVTVRAAPHFRLYTNAIGGGQNHSGSLFPQDEFYDAYMQAVMKEVATRAQSGAHVASEIPTLADYYARRAGRSDLLCVELSDPAELSKLSPGDFVIDARGRTYFSNQAMLSHLRQTSGPAFTIPVGALTAADVYILDQRSLTALRGY